MGVRQFGAQVQRTEDPRILTGRGRYLDDIALPGMFEAAFVRSTEAHALIRGIDAEAARAVPGVVAVLTMDDFGAAYRDKRLPLPSPHPAIRQPITQQPLARSEVCYVGEAIALVLAETRYLAEDAAALVGVDYEPLPAVADAVGALAPDAPKVHHGAPDNLVATLAARFGDAAAAFARAPHVLRETYLQDRGGGHSLECRGVIAQHDAATGQLTLWSSTQSPYMVRRFLAQYLGREETSVRVIAPDVGGGFGPKAAVYAEEYALALAAIALGRPVKWVEDRREHFVATNQQRRQRWDMEVAADGGGRILALRGRVTHDHGAYAPYGLVLPFTSLAPLPGPYLIPNVDVTLDVAFTNATPTSPVRGAGRPNVAFALERLVDLVARELKLDRAEVRRVNLVKTFPHATGAKLPSGVAVEYDSGDYVGCLDLVLRACDYAGFAARRAAALKQGRRLGLGLASYNEDTGMGPFEGALVRVLPTGKLQVATGACAQGQGLATVLAQICADEFGVGVDDVIVEAGDTNAFPLGMSTVGSRVAVTAGSSVHLAARAVRDKAIRLAAELLECAEQDLEVDAGAVRVKGVPGKQVGLGQLAQRLAGSLGMPLPAGLAPGLEAVAYHSVSRPVYASGSNAAEVEVDAATGEVKLIRYWVAHDCGRLINPLLVEGQIVGGVAHGIGNALYETMVYDAAGQPLSTTLGEYLLPTAPELPPIEVAHLESPAPSNPLGIKGAGEGGTIPAAPTVIAAIEDALADLGVRIREYPLSPQRLIELIEPIDGAGAAPAD
ncbi:MAG TPA: xanthine dehydrogenase family protein molybdopterin-binding subunit [Burkholderiales bacterium]|nr:xanthine dehydrogenase family protein molybdopterin-binding subunit [Burkholderiales bacterium]